ncbi:MAG: tocopherol cyclase family protein [Erysipelotrichaceae bacterium]
MLRDYFNKIKNPFIFQGKMSYKHYFEGWYFKQVDTDSKTSLSLIFGISLNPKKPSSFIQVILKEIHQQIQTWFIEYPIEAFRVDQQPYTLHIDKSHFSLDEVHIDISTKDLMMKADLSYDDLHPLTHSFYSPNIMGPFAYLPMMQCSHGIVSMKHTVNGTAQINQVNLVFNQGRGYIEKDWGSSFPNRYVWVQANHFELEDVGFMLSVASIPVAMLSFEGIIAQVSTNNKVYRIATYYGAKKQSLKMIENGFELAIKQGHLTLKVIAKYEDRVALKSPRLGEMSSTIKEGLGGIVEIELLDKKQTLLKLKSAYSGIEVEAY